MGHYFADLGRVAPSAPNLAGLQDVRENQPERRLGALHREMTSLLFEATKLIQPNHDSVLDGEGWLRLVDAEQRVADSADEIRGLLDLERHGEPELARR